VKEPQDFPLAGVVCKELCGGSRVICGHICPLPCRNRCQHVIAICKLTVSRKLECGHMIEMFCRRPMTPRCISVKCVLLLPGCLHPCPAKCSQPCDRKLCDVIVDFPDSAPSAPLPYNHQVRGPCKFLIQPPWRRPSAQMDKSPYPAPCSTILSFGHRCSSKCGECTSFGEHSMCRSPCDRKLICNHDCQSGRIARVDRQTSLRLASADQTLDDGGPNEDFCCQRRGDCLGRLMSDFETVLSGRFLSYIQSYLERAFGYFLQCVQAAEKLQTTPLHQGLIGTLRVKNKSVVDLCAILSELR